MTSEYERGYRDGLIHAAELCERYITEAPDPPSADAAEHLRTVAMGLRSGAAWRDLEGRGEWRG